MNISRKASLYTAALLGAVTFAVYLPALRNDFVGVWDDNLYIVENLHIRRLDLSFLRWAFLDFYASNWHPVTWMSHAIDYAVWGLNPSGHHLTSIAIHAVNAALVALLIIAVLEIARKRSDTQSTREFLNDSAVLIIAGVAGLLFGIHPLHVESVAWASERKDVLCGLFSLLSMLVYSRYVARLDESGAYLRQEGKGTEKRAGLPFVVDKRYLAASAFFLLALLSKPMAVTLPVVLLIMDWYPFARITTRASLRAALVEKLPFMAFSLMSSVITILAQKSGGSPISADAGSLLMRLLVAGHSLAAYLGNLVAPVSLGPYYPYPQGAALASAAYPLAVLAVGIVTIVCAVLAAKQRLWTTVWAYYVVTLLPVIGIVQVGNQSMADRYTYLPGLALFLMAGFAAAWIFDRVKAVQRARVISAGLILLFCLSLSVLSVRQINTWNTDFTLWDTAIAKGFESATAYNNRGLALERRGQLKEAAADFEKAIAIDSANFFAFNNRGVLFGKEGRVDQSIQYFKKAIGLNATHADSYCNLGVSYFSLKQFPLALENYTMAIRLKPDFDAAYLNRGNVYYTMGDARAALEDYRRACMLGNEKACEALHLLAPSIFAADGTR